LYLNVSIQIANKLGNLKKKKHSGGDDEENADGDYYYYYYYLNALSTSHPV
jgi:hypothetical protein